MRKYKEKCKSTIKWKGTGYLYIIIFVISSRLEKNGRYFAGDILNVCSAIIFLFFDLKFISVWYYWLANELVLLEPDSTIPRFCSVIIDQRKPISKVMIFDANCQQTAKSHFRYWWLSSRTNLVRLYLLRDVLSWGLVETRSRMTGIYSCIFALKLHRRLRSTVILLN